MLVWRVCGTETLACDRFCSVRRMCCSYSRCSSFPAGYHAASSRLFRAPFVRYELSCYTCYTVVGPKGCAIFFSWNPSANNARGLRTLAIKKSLEVIAEISIFIYLFQHGTCRVSLGRIKKATHSTVNIPFLACRVPSLVASHDLHDSVTRFCRFSSQVPTYLVQQYACFKM